MFTERTEDRKREKKKMTGMRKIAAKIAVFMMFAVLSVSPVYAGTDLPEGSYLLDAELSGGSGKASVMSPAEILSDEDGITAVIVFSSPNYDYLLLDGKRYEPVSTDENSVFEIPVEAGAEEIFLTADTTAMSTPHEIDYTLCLDWDSLRGKENSGEDTPPETEEFFREGTEEETEEAGEVLPLGEDWCGLTFKESLPLRYASRFSVDYFEGGYKRIVIAGTDEYLLVPEGMPVPEDLPEDAVILRQPLDGIYLLATSAMDFFCSLDALDAVRLTGTEEDGWYIEEAARAMEEGRILYAGKYSAPDYEMVLSEDCSLAIESTMIYHTPEVKEELESLGIPVLVERSSYEETPLGRMEWIKLYGALLDLEEKAEALFDEKAAQAEEIGEEDPLGKTVVFFYIRSDGIVNVRRPNDYISKMIEMAGGTYLFGDLEKEGSADTAISMTTEEFYAEAKDADYLIYNSTTGGELYTVDELLDQSALLADFKAVQEGNVWCTGKNLFQETMSIGDAVYQLHVIFTEENPDPDEITFLHRLTGQE